MSVGFVQSPHSLVLVDPLPCTPSISDVFQHKYIGNGSQDHSSAINWYRCCTVPLIENVDFSTYIAPEKKHPVYIHLPSCWSYVFSRSMALKISVGLPGVRQVRVMVGPPLGLD